MSSTRFLNETAQAASPSTATLNPTLAAIDTQTLTYAPAVIAGVQAAEVSGASGQSKLQAVTNGIQQGAAIAENAPIPNVAAIAGLVNLIVSIFNSTGVFSHRSPSTTATK